MTGSRRREDARIGRAVEFLLRCRGAKVPEAMRAVKFTLKESANATKQMAVRRAYAKAIGGKMKSPLPAVSIDASANTSTLSPLTEPTPRTTTTTTSTAQLETTPDGIVAQKPKPRQIRRTASGMQKWRLNKFDATGHAKRAFKRATSWYSKELEKSDGLSSYQISKKVKMEFDGAGPSATTLRRYAKLGLAGESPQIALITRGSMEKRAHYSCNSCLAINLTLFTAL